MYFIVVLGGANVWSGFSNFILINAPNGCLLNQKGSLLILFERNNKSKKNNIKFYSHLSSSNKHKEAYKLEISRLLSLLVYLLRL